MLQVDEDESAQVEPDDRQTHPERLLDQKYSERHEKRAIIKNIEWNSSKYNSWYFDLLEDIRPGCSMKEEIPCIAHF